MDEITQFLQDPEVQKLLHLDKVQQLIKKWRTLDEYANALHEQNQNLAQEASETQAVKRRRDELKQKLKSSDSELRMLEERVVDHRREVEEVIKLRPKWLQEQYEISEDALAYVLMPYRVDWFEKVYEAIAKALKAQRWKCMTAKLETGSEIKDDFWRGLCRARLVVADLTDSNPNVTYEIGLAHLLGKPMILIAQSPDVTFYFRVDRIEIYDKEHPEQLERDLINRIGAFARWRSK